MTRDIHGASTTGAFLLVVVVGGINFVAVRISNTELEPFWGAAVRFGLAGLIFVLAAVLLRLKWPDRKQLGLLALYGLFNFTISYALMYWALVRVSAGLAAVLLAVVPLVTPFLAAAHRMERIGKRHLIGAVWALAGILVMTVGPAGVDIPADGLLAIGVAALALGEGVIVGKKVAVGHPAMTNAVGMPLGAAGLLLISLFAGESWVIPQQSDVVWSVGYLALIGSAGMFVLILLIARRWAASTLSYLFVLFPVVTMLSEALLLDEPLTVPGVVGALIVMSGVWFGALAPRRGEPDVATRGEPMAETAG